MIYQSRRSSPLLGLWMWWSSSGWWTTMPITLSSVVTGAPLQDLIPSLPLYGIPPSPMFSGFLDASAGCDTVTNGPICKLHYWFALAESPLDPLEAPVVLWLNGGPGSSSVLGFLQENGPLLINATGGFHRNPFSWTRVANLLVLEAPVGVGYSYCSRQLVEGLPCVNTDRFTASASRAALVDFFQNKFPELRDNAFFITGESYAGVYIPTLAKEILDDASSTTTINLMGLAVGDPCTDNTAQNDSMDALWYGHKYGLVDDAIFDTLWNRCRLRVPSVWALGGPALVAAKLNARLHSITNDSTENTTAATTTTPRSKITAAPMTLSTRERQRRRQLAHHVLWDFLESHVIEAPIHPTDDDDSTNDNDDDYPDNDECRLAYRKFLMSSSDALSQSWKDLYIDDYNLFGPVTSKEDQDMANYMNRRDVRKALHVEESPTTSWPTAGVRFDYTKEYDACNWNDEIPPGTPSMIDFYRTIVPKLAITYVYNGDTDPCLSWEGTVTAIKRVGFPELDGGGYRPWFYHHGACPLHLLAEKAPKFGPDLLAQDMGVQFGGEVVNYEYGLSFLTIHGSGHMVPQFRPQAALHMLTRLISFQELTPLFPSNETIAAMNNTAFYNYMMEWTERAMSPPYIAIPERRHDDTIDEERTDAILGMGVVHDVDVLGTTRSIEKGRDEGTRV